MQYRKHHSCYINISFAIFFSVAVTNIERNSEDIVDKQS